MNIKDKVEETVLRAFDKVLEPVYLALEASEAENLHCEVARVAQDLLEQAQRDAVEGFARWCDIDQEAIYNHPHFMQDYADQYLNQTKEDINPKEGE